MSRIGIKPIPVPDGVKVELAGATVKVEGPVGKLEWTHRPEVSVAAEDGGKTLVVSRSSDEKFTRALHGLTRSLIANMIEGCAKGYQRDLEVYGVGYGVELKGASLSVMCGRSHPVVLQVPDGVTVDVQTPQARGDNDPAKVSVKGADKQAVGEFAARIRKARTPEPYKGKGVRYAGERIRRKMGKAFAGGG